MTKTTEYTYEGDGIINSWAVPFAYLKKSHVKVYIDDVEDTTFTWLTDSSVAATSTPADGAVVRVKRVTPRDALDTVLGNSGTFRGNDINNQSRQALYVAEEGYDALVGVLQLDATVNEWDFESYQSKNIPTPTSDDSAANKAYVDAVAGSATAAAASASAAAASASTASTAATNASNSASAASSSASSASTSAATATTKAAEAAASAASVAGEADAAAASAVTAASEASDAADSATAAAASQSAAAGSATAAAGSASAASTSATNAASSASSASTSASTATTQAGIATTKATEASNSATAAAGSATTASGHATTATTQAGIATTQATNASNSASAASTSATNAANSETAAGNAQTAAEAAQTAAELALDTFDDIWLGSKASEPSVDNDGNALQQGALYWNSTSDDLWIYNAGAWEVAAIPMSSGVTKTGTPADNQIAVWTADGIIEGTSGLTWDGSTFLFGSTCGFANSSGTMVIRSGGAEKIALGSSFRPTANDGVGLGQSGFAWSDLFLASGGTINFNAGDVTLTHSANSLELFGGRLTVNYGSDTTPLVIMSTGSQSFMRVATNSGTVRGFFGYTTLGVGALSFLNAAGSDWTFQVSDGGDAYIKNDLMMPSGGTINFDAGDVTLTHAANVLRLEGGQLEVYANNAIIGYDGSTEGGVYLTKTSQYGNPAVQAITSGFGTATLELNPAGGAVTIGTGNAAVKYAGKETIWVPAKAMSPEFVGPASATYGSGSLRLPVWQFDPSTDEGVTFQFRAPKSWNLGAIAVRVVWTAASGSGNAVWAAYAMARSDDDPIGSGSYGSNNVIDTLLAANDMHISGDINVTVGNTPAAGDYIDIIVRRGAANGSDTLAVDAILLGVEIIYTSNAPNDD